MGLGLLPQFINTSALRYFYEVARCGSLREASEKIHIAASAIGRQIQLLEDELGVALFQRSRKGVCLTAAGEALVYRVRRAMNELAMARAEMEGFTGQHFGAVSVGANETIGREFLTDFVVEMHSQYPGIMPSVTIGNTAALVDLLLRGDIELMVGYGVPAHVGLERIASFTLRRCIMVHVSHRFAKLRSVQFSDLANENFILPDASLSLRRALDSMFLQASIKSQTVLITNSFEMMANLVAAGLGIGAQVRLRSGRDNIRPDIVYVPIKDNGVRPESLACCVRAGHVPSVAVSIFTQKIEAALKEWSKSMSYAR